MAWREGRRRVGGTYIHPYIHTCFVIEKIDQLAGWRDRAGDNQIPRQKQKQSSNHFTIWYSSSTRITY